MLPAPAWAVAPLPASSQRWVFIAQLDWSLHNLLKDSPGREGRLVPLLRAVGRSLWARLPLYLQLPSSRWGCLFPYNCIVPSGAPGGPGVAVLRQASSLEQTQVGGAASARFQPLRDQGIDAWWCGEKAGAQLSALQSWKTPGQVVASPFRLGSWS